MEGSVENIYLLIFWYSLLHTFLRFFIIHITACLLYSNVRSDGFHLGHSPLKRPLRWVSSRAFGPQTSVQMGFFSGLRPSNVRSDGFHLGPSPLKRPFRWVSSRGLRPSTVRSDGFHLGPSALKCPFRWVSSRAFGPQTSVQMGFISGLRPSNVRSDGFHLGPSAFKRRRLGSRPQNAPDVGVVPLPQNSNLRNFVKVDPNFLEKIFLYSTHQGLSNDISFDPLHSFLASTFLVGFFPEIFKKS